MDDLIRRQAILDMLEDINNHIIDGYGYKHDWCVEWVNGLPSIDAVPQWIPCSERLPEEKGQYLITVKYKHVDGYDDIYAEHGEWYDGKWDMFCFGHCGEVEDIIAWMPLPKPYERKEE